MISNCAPVVARGRSALRRSSAIGLGLKPWLPSLQPPFPVVRPLSSRRQGDCVASKICSCHIHRRGTIPTRAVWKDPSCQARSTQRWNQQSRRRPVPCRHRHRSSRSPRQRRRAPSRAHARPAARRGATPLRFRTNGCNILQCGDCGLGRTETSGFDPAAYYTKDYLSGTCDRACGSPLEDRPGLADRFPIAAHAWNALGEHANCESYRDTYQQVRCHACRSAESALIGVRLASPPLRCDHPSQLHSKRASTSGSPCARNFLGICEFLFITNRGTSDGTCLSGAGVCRHPGL